MPQAVATTTAAWTVYQPLIVGLGAVILTTIGNTLLEWWKQHHATKREAVFVKRAFLEELKAHRRMTQEAFSDEAREDRGSNLLVPLDRFFPVYDNMIGRIGALKPEQAAAILRAYSFLLLIPKQLGIFGKLKKDEHSTWIEVEARYSHVVAAMNSTTQDELDEAIRCLS